jgi:hypothetical protein
MKEIITQDEELLVGVVAFRLVCILRFDRCI